MKSKFILIPLILVLSNAAPLLPAQEAGQDGSVLALRLLPGLSIPLGEDRSSFTLGGGAALVTSLAPPGFPFLALEAGAGYSIAPLDIGSGKPVETASLSLIAPVLGVAADLPLRGRLQARAFVHGGYFFAGLDTDGEVTSDSNPLVSAGAGLAFRLFPSLSIGLEAHYRNFLGLYNDLMVCLGTTYHVQRRRVAGGILSPQLRPYRDLELSAIELRPVFPVFYKYYDDHAIGRLTIRNGGRIPLEDVRISVFVNQYMDNPNLCAEIPFLKGGQELEVDLIALFNDRVLGISEMTKVQVNVTVESTVAGDSYGNETVETLRIHDRNAVTWSDDRHAAAFVTLKDPTVLKFAKNVSSMVQGKASGALNGSFLKAVALFEALSLYGISYQVDPSTPYEKLSRETQAVDYIQFPNQTLEYKAGDCDDLSILYCALLESLGIETAFITIPGHIYTAFSLGLSPEEAAREFSATDNLIFGAGTSWLPVEITLIGEGLLAAWDTGAREWREHEPQGRAALVPVHAAWEIYEPVGFSGEVLPITLPGAEALVGSFQREIRTHIEREIYPRVARLQEQIRTSQDNPRYINSLGVIYARYGLNREARDQFERALARAEHLPALVNLGNLAFLNGELENALAYYLRARRLEQANPGVLLGLAKVHHELGDLAEASRYYAALKDSNPGLAARHAYLERAGEAKGVRAAETQQEKEAMEWLDE